MPRRLGSLAIDTATTRASSHSGIVAGLLFCLALWSPATRAGDAPPSVPAEEARFNNEKFHEELRSRGLAEILELHLAEFPPQSAVQANLLRRDVRLAEYADRTQSWAEREAALIAANRLLEEVIASSPDDLRRFEWRFTLARSLIYEEGEPAVTDLLYRADNERDRGTLAPRVRRAIATLNRLIDDLRAESARLDQLPPREFELLENTEHIERIDRIGPQSEYLLLWAKFFDALSRSAGDSTRSARLHEVMDSLRAALATQSQSPSPAVVETSLLAGLVCRRLNDHAAARDHLERAVQTLERIPPSPERNALQWAGTLALIEEARNDADEGRFDDALAEVGILRKRAADDDGEFQATLIASLTERYVDRASAASAERAGRATEARRLREASWAPLLRWLSERPGIRNDLYLILDDLADDNTKPADLDPIEIAAIVARSLPRADQAPEHAADVLTRARNAGERFLQQPESPAALIPEVQFNVAIVAYRLGDAEAAVRHFLAVARDHSGFVAAPTAASHAVQLAHEIYAEAAQQADADGAAKMAQIRPLYIECLNTLVEHYPRTEAASYWRYHYAAALVDAGDWQRGIDSFAAIDSSHPMFLEAQVGRARSLAHWAAQQSATPHKDAPNSAELINRFQDAERSARTAIATAAASNLPDRIASAATCASEMDALAAEVALIGPTSRPADALAALDKFEDRHTAFSAYLGRVWRARLVAYEQLGQINEARLAIPAYVAADPAHAGRVLQGIYTDLAAQADAMDRAAQPDAFARKSGLALLLAEQIDRWNEQARSAPPRMDPESVKLQFAQALLRAGEFERAAQTYGAMEKDREARKLEPSVEVTLGLADSQFGLKNCAEALPRFNRVAVSLPADDARRWRALLGDLECRIALGHPADGVLRVIRQQRSLHPNLGGRPYAEQFEAIERRIGQ